MAASTALAAALLSAAAAGALLPAGTGASWRLQAGLRSDAAGRLGSWGRWKRWGPWEGVAAGRLERALRTELGDLLLALTAELRAGADPRAALAAAGHDLPLLAEVSAAARSPVGDVARALESVALRPGGASAGRLAVAWRVAEATGCPLAEPVARLHASLRAEETVRREVDAQLAGPRATARLLALLPVVGVMLGTGLGADPAGFLLGTPAGRACLIIGVSLSLLGLRWTRRITAAVLPAPDR